MQKISPIDLGDISFLQFYLKQWPIIKLLENKEFSFITGRKFHLLLKPSVPLSSDFKASAVHSDGSTSVFAVNKDLYFEGTSKTDPGSSVHLQWENDLAIISVNTKEEKYFFEVICHMIYNSRL